MFHSWMPYEKILAAITKTEDFSNQELEEVILQLTADKRHIDIKR